MLRDPAYYIALVRAAGTITLEHGTGLSVVMLTYRKKENSKLETG